MKCLFKLFFITLPLTNCSFINNKNPIPVVVIKNNEFTKQSAIANTISQLTNTPKINWTTVIVPLVNQILEVPDIKLGKSLLIDSIKNNTNIKIQLIFATETIINTIKNQNIFKVISHDMLLNARKNLGLSQKNILVTCSNTIGLARYIQADYVLYSVIYSDQQQIKIEMQLIATKTGEILWLGRNLVK